MASSQDQFESSAKYFLTKTWFYTGGNTCWLSVNQVNLIGSPSLLFTHLDPKDAVRVCLDFQRTAQNSVKTFFFFHMNVARTSAVSKCSLIVLPARLSLWYRHVGYIYNLNVAICDWQRLIKEHWITFFPLLCCLHCFVHRLKGLHKKKAVFKQHYFSLVKLHSNVMFAMLPLGCKVKTRKTAVEGGMGLP